MEAEIITRLDGELLHEWLKSGRWRDLQSKPSSSVYPVEELNTEPSQSFEDPGTAPQVIIQFVAIDLVVSG